MEVEPHLFKLKKKLNEVGTYSVVFAYNNLKREITVKILAEVDKSGEGIIRFDDFLDIMTQKMLERDPVEEMKKAFHLICEEGQDKITLKSLQKVAKELGENMSVEELQEMIEEADRDGDGEIGEEDFLKVMKKTNLF